MTRKLLKIKAQTSRRSFVFGDVHRTDTIANMRQNPGTIVEHENVEV